MSQFRNALAATVVAIGILTPSVSNAQDLSSDRPDFTETASTVKGAQLETGYTLERAGSLTRHSFGEALLRVGLASRIELRLGANSYIADRAAGRVTDGFDDVSLGAKFEVTRHPEVALIVTAGLPTGTTSLGGGEGITPEVTLALDRSLNRRVGFGTNIGIASVPTGSLRATALSGSAVLGFDATDKTGLFAEVFGTRILNDEAGDHSVYMDGGITRAVNADFQLDARAGVRLNQSGDWFFGVGAVKRWR